MLIRTGGDKLGGIPKASSTMASLLVLPYQTIVPARHRYHVLSCFCGCAPHCPAMAHPHPKTLQLENFARIYLAFYQALHYREPASVHQSLPPLRRFRRSRSYPLWTGRQRQACRKPRGRCERIGSVKALKSRSRRHCWRTNLPTITISFTKHGETPKQRI